MESDERVLDRRKFLQGIGAAGLAGTAGCLSEVLGGRATPDTPTNTETPTEQTETPTETATEPPEPPENFEFDFSPADDAADYAVSPLFDDVDAVATRAYELDLQRARQHHFNDLSQWAEPYHPELWEFYENIDDQEWVDGFLQRLSEQYDWPDTIGGVLDPPSKIDFTWDAFESADGFQDRVVDTEFFDLYITWDAQNFGGVTARSTRNEMQAALWQKIWREKLEEDTHIFGFTVMSMDGGSHGVGTAIQNPATYPDNYDSQTAYEQALDQQQTNHMETGFGNEKYDQTAVPLSDVDYLREGALEWREFWHPALFDGTEPQRDASRDISYEQAKDEVEGMFAALVANSRDDWEFDSEISLTNDCAAAFADWMEDPTTRPAQHWIDRSATVYELSRNPAYQETDDVDLVVGLDGIYGFTDETVVENIDTQPGQTYDDLDAVVEELNA